MSSIPPSLPSSGDESGSFEATIRVRRYVVLGAGRSGLAAARLLHSLGHKVLLCDEKTPDNMDDQLSELCEKRIDFQFGSWTPAILRDAAALVLSPGIAVSHPMAQEARDRGVPVIGELELGASVAEPPIFAITGTNGKTTTTALIAHILTECGYDAPSCGNIGRAFCDTILAQREPGRGTILVTEVSSFQLETVQTFHPAAAWILNLTPDHLDRHGDMEGYLEAKARITMNQQPGDALVLNADDPWLQRLVGRTWADIYHFSRNHPVEMGAYVRDGAIRLARPSRGQDFPLMPVADLPLPGGHNIENALAASMVTLFCDLDPIAVANALRSFRGVEHRIELVCEHSGVRYYNDSKATNLDAMSVALQAFEGKPLVLLAGGLDSGFRFETLGDLVKRNVRHVVAFGEAGPHILAAWRGLTRVEHVETMFDAAMIAIEVARAGDNVLLSPGCKSFDQFRNYEERGRKFKAIIRETLLGRPDAVVAPQARPMAAPMPAAS